MVKIKNCCMKGVKFNMFHTTVFGFTEKCIQ